MKRLIVVLFTLLVLVACATEDVSVEHEESEESDNETVEMVISESEHDLTLIDNDDLSVTLTNNEQTRIESYETIDELTLQLTIDNKQNKTINVHIDDLYIDGDGDWSIGMSETEIKPNETGGIEVIITKDILADDKTISFQEHIKGRIIYSSYDGIREEETFNEYIN